MACSIVPLPAHVEYNDAAFRLDPETELRADGPAAPVAETLATALRPATGFALPVRPAAEPARYPVIRLALGPQLPPSGYALSVTSAAVRLDGGDPAGLFHATQTLLQLLPPAILRRAPVPGMRWTVSGVEVVDRPRFGWRGFMLDTSRHFFGKDLVLKLIDALALHRMNVLHLHLTDDQGWRVEIRRYPLLTEVGARRRRSSVRAAAGPARTAHVGYDETPHGGYYTQDDLREIVAYAAQRHITVVPEIDLPGHSQAAIAAYPSLGNTAEPVEVWTDWGVSPHVLNVEDTTVAFYENVLSEIIDIFPGPYVHLGGDECPTGQWRDSPAAQRRVRELGLSSERDLQGWLTRHFAGFLAERGRRLIGWDEILDGDPPDSALVMSWRGEAGGVAAARAGRDTVMCPERPTYLYYTQGDDPAAEPPGALPAVTLRDVHAYDPMPAGLDPAAQAHVLGAQCNMWTEYVTAPRQLQQLVFPRLCAFAEAVWCTRRDSFDRFETRLASHVERLRALDLAVFEPPAPTASRDRDPRRRR